MIVQPPWASGPGELLRHGLELLKRDSDVNRRLAMISIDNSVELMIKTYLGLPKRVTGLEISRKEYQEFSESFPQLLDALEKHAESKLKGIDLGEIEWYHRLRNQLYHQGNGLTVERDKVEVYAELAKILFLNLFGFELVAAVEGSPILLGEFMQAWVNFESIVSMAVNIIRNQKGKYSAIPMLQVLVKENVLSASDMAEISKINKIRNEVVHGLINHKEVLNYDLIKTLQVMTKKISDWLPG